MIEIIVKKGDLTREICDAIVNPANSYGMMGGGVALAIRNLGGEEIEKEAMENSPLLIGKAIATTAGNLPSRFVIHSPTMKKPAERGSLKNVEKATHAALECANNLSIKTVAFPGMGTGVGGIGKKAAAEIMIKTIKNFINNKESKKELSLNKIILIGFDDELANEFMRWKQKLKLETR